MTLTWSPTALQRVGEVIEHISQDSPKAALDWIDGLEARLDLLLEMPEQGRSVPEWFGDPARQILYGRYRVIYQVSGDAIEVLTVRMDRKRLLESEETDPADSTT